MIIKTPNTIIVRESIIESITKDAFTFSVLGAFIAVGIVLDNSVIQVLGALMGFLFVLVKAALKNRSTHLTTEEAITYLQGQLSAENEGEDDDDSTEYETEESDYR